MATIGTDPGGRRRILFLAGDGTRKTIRLGRCDLKTAQAICRHVEALLSVQLAGQPIPRATAAWLGSIGTVLRDRLARAGLIEGQQAGPESMALGQFLAEYLAQRPDLSPATQVVMRQAARPLVAVLGENTKLSQVTPADADRFKAWLVERGCSRSTVAKWCRYARHFFAVAVRREVIAKNPFGHLKGAVVGDPARRKFIPAQEVCRVLEAIPCPQFRALVVLARWGGLRIPSEALNLRWSDVNWEKCLFIVGSPKTAHHASGGIRTVPLFPEVRTVLDELWQLAPEGEDRILTRLKSSAQNLRTQLARYCERAGVIPWPKPFQNLRVSRATELADRYPSHVCAAWLGHTERIADAFYRQVTTEHWQSAVSSPNALTLARAAQNPAQQRAETSGIERQDVPGPLPDLHAVPPVATGRDSVQVYRMGPTGLKPVTKGL